MLKGFPNQIADFSKLAKTMKIISDLLDEKLNPSDDGILGEALVRFGIAGAGHRPIPIEKYLLQMANKPKSNQSHRTMARGLRELFSDMRLIHIHPDEDLSITDDGKMVASFSDQPITDKILAKWRQFIVRICRGNTPGNTSHPYQVLLRLVSRSPGISRAKCALALEAKDDSEQELERILALSRLSEEDIIKQINTSKSNWDNGKKILPRFAEQLNDVRKENGLFFPIELPGNGNLTEIDGEFNSTAINKSISRSISTTKTTADIIAKTGLIEPDEADDGDALAVDPVAVKRRKEIIKARTKRHNALVRRIAKILELHGASLFENPYDCLGILPKILYLVEVKSLDGTDSDEMHRVRDALGQLLYYEAFLPVEHINNRTIVKIAFFESKITNTHIQLLRRADIIPIWMSGDALTTGIKENDLLYPEFLRI